MVGGHDHAYHKPHYEAERNRPAPSHSPFSGKTRLRPTVRIRPPMSTRPRPGSTNPAPVPGTGTGTDEVVVHVPAGGVMRLVSNVSAPFRARARPVRIFAPVTIVILVSAIKLP